MTGGGDQFWDRVFRILANMSTLTYYDLLGVPPGADSVQLSEGFRNAVRAYHPDRYANERDKERVQALNRVFARINEAYRVLSRAELRQQYDQGLAQGVKRQAAPQETGRRRYRETRDPVNDKARRCFERARELTDAGNFSAARSQLLMALQFEKGSEILQAAVDELNQKIAETKK